MPVERILITVKTYPTLSMKHQELVCTAGLREDGSWIRIYPVPFRQMEAYNKYHKYQVVEAEVIRNTADRRPESHKVNLANFHLTEDLLPAGDWRERRDWVLKKGKVFTNLNSLIQENKEDGTSLATFKPTRIVSFKHEAVSPDWDPEKLETAKQQAKQGELFSQWKGSEFTHIAKKVPWKFSYVFEDDEGKQSTMMIEDWEIGELYWKCLKRHPNPEDAVAKVREKYIDEFSSRDIHLFLGTTKKFDQWASNPFIIIGVFYPPVREQEELELF